MNAEPCERYSKTIIRLRNALDAATNVGVYPTSGRCEKLTADNRCSVYEQRPMICRVDRMLRLLKVDPVAGYRATIAICNKLMDDEGLPESLRIKGWD